MAIRDSDITGALSNMGNITNSSVDGTLTVQVPSDSGNDVSVKINRQTGICTSDGKIVGTLSPRKISGALPSSITPHDKKE